MVKVEAMLRTSIAVVILMTVPAMSEAPLARPVESGSIESGPIESYAIESGAWMRDLQQYDAVLATIGYRLMRGAADLCPAAPLLGFAVHDISQYETGDREVARQTFGFVESPLVLAVADSGPAAVAGLRVDDSIETINGAPIVPPPPGGAASYDHIDHVLDLLDSAATRGPVALGIRRAGAAMAVQITPSTGCAARFQVRQTKSVNAGSAGIDIEINTKAMRFAGDDGQIAAIAGHELAHTILGHRARLAGIKKNRTAAIRATEEEADRLSVYLLDRAGYPTSAIVTFWQRYRANYGAGIFRSASHLGEKKRIAIIEEERSRIAAMKARGETPLPAFLVARR